MHWNRYNYSPSTFPRRACAAMVTVVVLYMCVRVCLSVCVSITTTYSTTERYVASKRILVTFARH